MRIGLMAALLIFCVPFYYLWRSLRLPRFWPQAFLSGIGLIAGLRVTIRGRPERGALLIANHVSWLDIPALAHATGAAFVGHSGLSEVPLIRRLCAMNGTVFVDRNARANVSEQVRQVRAAIAGSGTLAIFPEGTTGDGTALLPFKSSLLAAAEGLAPGMAVQPVLLAYADASDIAWTGDEPGVMNFLRILARFRPVRLTLHFLPALKGTALTDRKTIAAETHKAIEQAMRR